MTLLLRSARASAGLALVAGVLTGVAGPAHAVAAALSVSATELAPLVQNSHVDTTIGGRDNGQSAGYGSQSVWFFDDTFERDPGAFVNNTAAITGDLNAADGITVTSATPYSATATGAPPEVVPRTLAEFAFQLTHNASGCTTATDPYCGSQYAYWPGPVVADPARNRVLGCFGKLCRGQSGASDPCYNDFVGQAIGTGVAALDMTTHSMSRLTVTNQTTPITSVEGTDPTMLFDPDHGIGGTSTVLVGSTLYAWGECNGLTTCKLGRVPVASVTDRAQWSFYTGTNTAGQPVWSSDIDAAVGTLNSGPAGGTVAWDAGLNAYLDVYMAPFSNTAMYATASNPWGPWSYPQTLFTGVAPTNGAVDYACFLHPEYAQNNGLTQYVTYYHPGDGVQHLVKVNFTVN
jgi:hypothetical protein